MEKSDYTIENIYQGGYSSLKPSSQGNVFGGYGVGAGDIGLAVDARTANVLKEISSKLSSGAKTIEVTQVFPEVFDSIPQDQLKELNRLSKLTGVDLTFHAPIVEPSGMTKEGFTESGRLNAERQMNMAIERSHDLNPNGGMPVTFHSSALLPGMLKQKIGDNIEKTPEEAYIINTESGSINKIPLKARSFPGQAKEPNIENEINDENEQAWTKNISQINYYAELGADSLDRSGYVKHLSDINQGKTTGGKMEERAKSEFNRGISFLQDSYTNLKQLFEIAYRKGSDNDKKILNNFYGEISDNVEKIKQNPNNFKNAELMREIVQKGTNTLKDLTPPKLIENLNDFAKKRTEETFAKVAFNAYDKFGDKSPIVSIENPPIGGAFSTGEELKEIVEKSREKFVEIAVKEGISKSFAKEQAEKLIGATWDVGHINMMRKYGYEDEDIIEESEKIAPFVKHVHLSDNFGLEHTELPMGMGNVPIKKIMEKLGKEGYKGKKIVEALNWWQHFSEGAGSPLKPTLEAMGSSIYAEGVGPYWSQSLGLQQNYSGGYGMMLPQTNYEMFGAGFAQLPTELGGQRQGAGGSRMSGRPME